MSKTKEPDYIRIYDLREITAAINHEILADIYRDGEIWAERQSLSEWRAKHPVPVLEEYAA